MGLVPCIKAMGQRVCAFGWGANSPLRDLIESAGIDGWIDGPSFGGGIDLQQLAEITSIMQAMRKHAQQYSAGGLAAHAQEETPGKTVCICGHPAAMMCLHLCGFTGYSSCCGYSDAQMPFLAAGLSTVRKNVNAAGSQSYSNVPLLNEQNGSMFSLTSPLPKYMDHGG